MAFGFGFNKQKVLSAAEKFVQQGKLQSAISEYEKVLKADPKDLTVSNTVGDLYARLGQSDKAVESFKSVGDAYASQGFTVKAIAMYKKLTKLKPTLEGVLRLAELYTQQGLFNDARAQYLQVAEEFMRTGELEQAVRIFQKTLEMDPENVAMRMRLAEVYVRLGKKTEAWQIFSAAAESLRSRGQLPAAEEILQRMLKLDPGNSYALLLRGRNAMESGDVPSAIEFLEKVADLDSHPEGLRSLMQGYLQTGRHPEAGSIAAKLFTVHNDDSAIATYANALVGAGQFPEALQLYQQYSDRLFAADSSKVLESLHSIISHVRGNPVALESLLELFHKAGENTHVTEVYELLAHAYVQSGELDKARDYYLKLTQLEPQNQLHARNYQQVLSKLGGSSGKSKLITAEEGAVLVEELEATAPSIDQRYSDEIALAVRAALTDAELFISYNMPAKALGPLLSALPLAPRDVRLNQRLAGLHTRASRFAEAAVCCRTLESVYHDAGYPEDATRYGELAGKYEERAATAPVEPGAAAAGEEPPQIAPKVAMPAPAAVTSKPAGLFFHTAAASASSASAEFEVHAAPAPTEPEIDLSEEWDDALADGTPDAEAAEPAHASSHTDDPAAIAETIEEIRFYLSHSMEDQARDGLAKLEKLTTDSAQVAALRQEIEAASAQPAAEAEEVTLERVDNLVEPEKDEAPKPPEPEPAALDKLVGDLESSLGENFLAHAPHADSGKQETEPEPAVMQHADASAATEDAAHDDQGTLGEFVADLEASLGDGFLPEAPVPQPQAEPEPETEPVIAKTKIPAPGSLPASIPVGTSGMAAAAAPALAPQSEAAPAVRPTFTYQPSKIRPLGPAVSVPAGIDKSAGIDLADMFGELKQELEEEANSSNEDPETHYNLGVAFREMGLLDEAIGELQKVCQWVERGHPFPQIMQTYTWLAQCFLDKGVPEAAVRWYETALKLPELDQDTRMALHYELGSSYESAKNRTAALTHFMEVYGSNIDYRDVAERINALKS